METQPLEQLLRKKPLKFVVGSGRVEYYIHPGLLSRLSAPLKDLVDKAGSTEEGCVTWADVDEEIFPRFVQFVYTGTYTDFSPADINNTTKQPQEPNKFMADVVKNPSENSGPKELPTLFFNHTATSEPLYNMENDAFRLPYSLASYQAAVTEWSLSCSMKPGSLLSSKRKFDAIACDWDFGSKGNPSKKKGDFIQAFRARYGDPTGAKSVFGMYQNIHQNGPANEAKFFEHVFIGHARICIFAHKYEITSLVNLSCTILARELAQWRISVSAFVPVFGELVRYVYNHAISGQFKIQQLIAQFAACVVEDVSDLEDWSSLLNEVPRFAADLVNEMTKRFG